MWFARPQPCPQPCPHPISFYCSATLSLQPHWLPGFSCCISGHYTRHSCHLEHSFSKELNGQFPRFPQDSAQMWLSPWRLLWSQLQLQTCPPPTILPIPLPCLVFSLNIYHYRMQDAFHLMILFIVWLRLIEWKPVGAEIFVQFVRNVSLAPLTVSDPTVGVQ